MFYQLTESPESRSLRRVAVLVGAMNAMKRKNYRPMYWQRGCCDHVIFLYTGAYIYLYSQGSMILL